MNDSAFTSNRYLGIWSYSNPPSANQMTRYSIWTEEGDPDNPLDNFRFFTDPTKNPIPIVWPWGSRLFDGQRPTPRNGTSGDDRPYCSVLTLHVEDSSATNGFTDFLVPENVGQELFPSPISLPDFQGFYTPFRVPAAPPSASGIDLEVTQKEQFARDLVRIETIVTNNSGQSRRVGARLLLDCFVDFWGPTKSVFIPKTREQVLFERDFTGAAVPDEWQMYDDDEAPDPIWKAKGVLRGNGATPPSRLVIGNTLDMFPFALANAQYNWVVRPQFELRISDIGTMLYWDPVQIPPHQTRTFVTYAGMGVADHAMSSFYKAMPAGQIAGSGYVGAVQSPFAIPLVNGDADTTTTPVKAYVQNVDPLGVSGQTAFITLPPGLELADTTPEPLLDLGFLNEVNSVLGGDEASGQWNIRANGIEAGLLPVNVLFGNNNGDTAQTTRTINVPQGRQYQFGGSDSVRSGWRMMTFPFDFTAGQNDPADVFGIPGGSFQILRFNPQINSYETVSEVQAGEAYWVRMAGLPTQFVRLSDNAVPKKLSQRSTFQTRLQRGWNQVGNPSPYAVPVRDLLFLSPTGYISYDEAVARNFIRQTMYQYNFLTGVYEPLNRDSILQPGRGIWIFSTAERPVVWPGPRGLGLSITP